MSERVTNTIYIDGNGVVGNNGDNTYPDIVMDLDPYRIGPRTRDFPSEPTINTETTDESTVKTWVNYIGEEYNKALTQGIIPHKELAELNSRTNYFQKLSYFKNNVKPLLSTGIDIQDNNGHDDTKPGPINYWGNISKNQAPDSEDQDLNEQVPSDQRDNRNPEEVKQIQAAKKYAVGWMRIAGVLEFISETELSPTERQLIAELYESGDLSYKIAMGDDQNQYQAAPEDFLKRIFPYRLEFLFSNNPKYQELYGNKANIIKGLYFEGRLPFNITLLPLEEFDESISAGIKTHDIDDFDYINRANRRMEGTSPAEKAELFQILSNDPQYRIYDIGFVRQERVKRAFKKVKGPLLEKARLGVVDIFKTYGNRRKSQPYELIETPQL